MRIANTAVLSVALMLVAGNSSAAEKPPQFWNLLASTVTSVELSPAGQEKFGPNQEVNDADGATDHDERLKLPGIATGEYDIRIGLKDGRKCLARKVKITAGKPFSLEEKNLVDCKKG